MPLSEEIKLALEVQQRAYKDLIEVVRSTLSDKIKQLEASNTELIVSLQFSQKEIDDLKKTCLKQDEKIIVMKKEIVELKNNKLEEELSTIKKRMDYQEDYSRRKNLRIDGIDENQGENWEMTQEKVQRLFREKLGMGDVQLERAHRLGSTQLRRDGEPLRPRTIVARLSRYSDRQQALRSSPKLKNTNIYLNEDLCEASVQERRAQLPELRRARAAGKIAYFSHTRLVIRERRGAAGTAPAAPVAVASAAVASAAVASAAAASAAAAPAAEAPAAAASTAAASDAADVEVGARGAQAGLDARPKRSGTKKSKM